MKSILIALFLFTAVIAGCNGNPFSQETCTIGQCCDPNCKCCDSAAGKCECLPNVTCCKK